MIGNKLDCLRHYSLFNMMVKTATVWCGASACESPRSKISFLTSLSDRTWDCSHTTLGTTTRRNQASDSWSRHSNRYDVAVLQLSRSTSGRSNLKIKVFQWQALFGRETRNALPDCDQSNLRGLCFLSITNTSHRTGTNVDLCTYTSYTTP